MKIFVAGCGGWGMALSMLLSGNGHEVTEWSFFEKECNALRETRCNEKLLPGVRLPEEITLTTDLSLAAQAEIVVMAVPSFAIHSTASNLAQIIPEGTVIVNVGKGLDKENGYCRFSETIREATGGKNPVVALTGPTHAEEVSRRMITCILAASEDQAAAVKVQDAFMNSYFRVYTTPDIVGAELGGCFKNIIALAAGISDGLGMGDNTKAALMTRGLTEIARLGIALGAKRETFMGLSGLGDLIVTCTSMHSRNRRAGIKIGQGMDVQQAMKEVGAVVEGYYATEAGYMLAKKMGIEMPITEGMYAALYQGVNMRNAVSELMGRDKKSELDALNAHNELWK
ncbi:MAG: NAD(P)H-dependent glycerol-3-phosphate dehydrogenase [Butyricicoccaceae bacterium]